MVGNKIATDTVGDGINNMVDSVAIRTIGGNAPEERIARFAVVASRTKSPRPEIVGILVKVR